MKKLDYCLLKKFSNNEKLNRNDFYCKNRLLSFVQMIILSNVNTKGMTKTFQLECDRQNVTGVSEGTVVIIFFEKVYCV